MQHTTIRNLKLSEHQSACGPKVFNMVRGFTLQNSLLFKEWLMASAFRWKEETANVDFLFLILQMLAEGNKKWATKIPMGSAGSTECEAHLPPKEFQFQKPVSVLLLLSYQLPVERTWMGRSDYSFLFLFFFYFLLKYI